MASISTVQSSSVQSLALVRLFVTPWTAAGQVSLFIANIQNVLKLKAIESVMPTNHLILCHPLLLLPSIFPSTRLFSNESVLCISSVQLSHSVLSNYLWTPTAARQASLSTTKSLSPPKPMSIKSVMPSNHHILCCPLLLPPSIFPSTGVFSNVGSSQQVAKVLEIQLWNQPFQWIFRTDFI